MASPSNMLQYFDVFNRTKCQVPAVAEYHDPALGSMKSTTMGPLY